MCYDRHDDESPCGEAYGFGELMDWMQKAVDSLPEQQRQGLPRLSDTLGLHRSPRRHGGFRSVVALRDLRANDMLMRIPMERLMHAGFYKSSEPGLVADFQQGLKGKEWETYVAPQTWLALYLMEQRLAGSASQWSPYMDLLPESFPAVPLFFKDEDWLWLEGSLFGNRVRKHRQALVGQYETVKGMVPGFSSRYSLEDYLWARTVISSRVFGWRLPGLDVEDTDFMVPLGDMFNHRSPKQIEWFFNDTSRTLDYRALEDVPAGSEILISYGSKCNSQYLLHYGFTTLNVSSRQPPVSTVRVAIALDADVPDRENREKWLLKARLKEPGDILEPEEFELKANSFKGAGVENMLGYARLLSLQEGKEFEQNIKGRSCRRFATPPRCDLLSLENERLALNRCLVAVEGSLAAYPTTLEQDEDLLPSLSGLPLTLVTLRRDEKVVLRWWLRFFQLATESTELQEDDIVKKAEEAFGEFSPETQYLRTSLVALISIHQKKKGV